MTKRRKDLLRRMVEIDYRTKNGHLASALSALPIIEEIYWGDFDPRWDVFILSKGHACVALYAVLESLGYHPDVTKLHPDIDVENGIACTTGSLGHGLPIALGMAYAKRITKSRGTVHVLLGDGECMEGTTWEALCLAENRVPNLKVWIDTNGYGALGRLPRWRVTKLWHAFPSGMVRLVGDLKGRGLPFYEDHPEWHVHQMTEDEYNQIMEYLK